MSNNANWGAQSTEPTPPTETMLERFQGRVQTIHSLISNIEGVADRACGSVPDAQSKPSAVPNGLLDSVDESLDVVVSRLDSLVARLRRIA